MADQDKIFWRVFTADAEAFDQIKADIENSGPSSKDLVKLMGRYSLAQTACCGQGITIARLIVTQKEGVDSPAHPSKQRGA